MSTDRETTRVVRSWLEEGVTALPDRVLDAVLDQVPATPQRRSWWPARRFTNLNSISRLAIAAAAIVVVVIGGYNLLPRTGGVGGNPTPAPTATPGATPVPLTSDDTVGLAAGDYVTGDPFPVRITATLPAGWHGHVAGPYYADLYATGTSGGLYFVRPSQVAIDPCNVTKGFADIGGETVDNLVAALRTVPGIKVTNVASTTIAGYRGTALVVTAPAVISQCTLSADGYTIWRNPLLGTSPAFSAGESIRFWILDVAGLRLVIANEDANYSAIERAQTQAVFDSIRIAPGS